MNNGTLVSVIIPVYNVEEFVRDSILSVENQTYENIELIIIDDASSDSSKSICADLASYYPNIKLFSNINNQGVEFSRNRGIQVSNGEWCVFVDADDKIDSNMIADLVEFSEKYEADVTFSAFSLHKNGKIVDYLNKSMPEQCMKVDEFVAQLLDNLSWATISCIGSKLYRRNLLVSNSIVFDRKYKYNEDGAFILDCLLVSKKVGYINYPYYKYQFRSSSTMASYREFDTMMNVVELLKSVFIKYDLFERKKYKYYNRYFMVTLDGLNNEVVFKSYESFREVVKRVKLRDDFSKMANALMLDNNILFRYKFVLTCLCKNWFHLLFLIIKTMQLKNSAKNTKLFRKRS